ncbi:MAG: tRNA (adenosine(37)-N6)-dimethylallyltransferase MiaA [bacterium]|nr:tRNA (adenosine(37)-N6)-dimethylallyltransferase MiaA [bacterium]
MARQLEEFLKMAKRPLIVVLGPTASGKTGISLKIAHQIGGEIISTDSRQIYKGMDIGTDLLSEEDQEGIAHHMLGITTPDQPLTLAQYRELALSKIEEIYKRGNTPMLVGGTGLYIDSIIKDYDIPRVPPDEKLRKKLQKELEKKGSEHIHKKLEKIDPKAAATIHPNNSRYIIRALEVAMNKSEKPVSHKKNIEFDVFMVGVKWPREELYKRVNERVHRQLKRGLTEEVKHLVEKGYDENLPAMSSLGVKEIIPYVRGEMALDECIEILKRNTRRYAKRQMTWFRRYDNVNWLLPQRK